MMRSSKVSLENSETETVLLLLFPPHIEKTLCPLLLRGLFAQWLIRTKTTLFEGPHLHLSPDHLPTMEHLEDWKSSDPFHLKHLLRYNAFDGTYVIRFHPNFNCKHLPLAHSTASCIRDVTCSCKGSCALYHKLSTSKGQT